MTKEEIIRMALEAEARNLIDNDVITALERFDALVVATERGEAWQQEREQLLTQIDVLRSQLLGIRMQFGEGSTISNLAADVEIISGIYERGEK